MPLASDERPGTFPLMPPVAVSLILISIGIPTRIRISFGLRSTDCRFQIPVTNERRPTTSYHHHWQLHHAAGHRAFRGQIWVVLWLPPVGGGARNPLSMRRHSRCGLRFLPPKEIGACHETETVVFGMFKP
ncbi:uncharacterized protein LOC120284406 [Drosophila simulans]|uniref:GD25486 n=1 Tax=Drosophila simulans TaxID=7240 RepID=B4QAR9_DROSI|nr:uncharacterized protein LOC120284406 [Drosophila simulans]EDX07470.1 GD25486 [Drosophila simulans]